ncbi:VOC family protein [Aquipuribacter nitratireducens]|uniref:VOC family protein n=1 Tax=Aquipuribacter nitratireducens TaxID=650104 RepID=A0ABW0GNQ8_9MICO
MTARLFAYLSYPDAPRALDWLAAVGFEVVARQDGPDGAVLHAEVRLGDVVCMVASDDAAYAVPPLVGRSTGAGLYLGTASVDEVDDFHAAAVAAGGRSVIDPEDTEWGTRRCRVLDPGGREWSAGTYLPGSSWG